MYSLTGGHLFCIHLALLDCESTGHCGAFCEVGKEDGVLQEQCSKFYGGCRHGMVEFSVQRYRPSGSVVITIRP